MIKNIGWQYDEIIKTQYTKEDIYQCIRVFFYISFHFSALMTSFNSEQLMLSSGNDIKEAILRQYDEVISIFDNCGELPASLREKIEKLREKLIEKRKEFSEEFCQVVVSGKTPPLKNYKTGINLVCLGLK